MDRGHMGMVALLRCLKQPETTQGRLKLVLHAGASSPVFQSDGSLFPTFGLLDARVRTYLSSPQSVSSFSTRYYVRWA